MYSNIFTAHPFNMQSTMYPPRNVQQTSALSHRDSLPERPKLQPPLKGTFSTTVYHRPRSQYSISSTPPTSSPPAQPMITKALRPQVVTHEPAQYTLDDGPRDTPGTAAYYKTWAFRQKVSTGAAQVPGQEGEDGMEIDDSDDEDYERKPRQKDDVRSRVMVFSRTNVRRANAQRKVYERMQRSNRRLLVTLRSRYSHA